MLYWKLVFRTSIVWFIDTALNALAGCLRTKTTDQLINMMGAPTLQPRPASLWAMFSYKYKQIKCLFETLLVPQKKKKTKKYCFGTVCLIIWELHLIHTHSYIILLFCYSHLYICPRLSVTASTRSWRKWLTPLPPIHMTSSASASGWTTPHWRWSLPGTP